MRVGRVLSVFVRVIAVAVSLVVLVVLVLQTGWFKGWLRGLIVRQANQYLEGSLSIERLSGNLLSGIRLENIALLQEGRPAVAVKELRLEFSLFQIASTGLAINSIYIGEPVVHVWRVGDGWSISRLVKKQSQEADRSGPSRPIAINALEISQGSIVFDDPIRSPNLVVPARFDRLNATLTFHYEPVRFTVGIDHLSFQGSDPALELSAFSGTVAVRDASVFLDKLRFRTPETSLAIDGVVAQYRTKPDLSLRVTSDGFSLPELAKLLPAIGGRAFRPTFEVDLKGPLDRLAVAIDSRSAAGAIDGDVVVDVHNPTQAVKGHVVVRDLDLAPLLDDPNRQSRMTVDASVDLRGERLSNVKALHGTVAFTAPLVAIEGLVAVEQMKGKTRLDGRRISVDVAATAYGAAVTSVGTVTLPGRSDESFAFDLRGSARQMDLQRLPRRWNWPQVPTVVNAAAYQVKGTAGSGSNRPARVAGDARLETSTVSGAQINDGSTVAFDVSGPSVAYKVDATVSGLDLERVGRDFNVPALSADRYKSLVNGHIVADVRGTTLSTLELTGSGELVDTSLFGVRFPQLSFNTAISEDTAQVTVDGRFAELDPGSASGRPGLEGQLAGTVVADATFDRLSEGLSREHIAATVMANLESSTVAGFAIDHGKVDGDFRNATADVRALEIVGRDFNANASGTLALDDTGQSNLKVHADTSNIEQFGKAFNRPFAGIGAIDGVVTGNKRELQAQGRAVFSSFKYGDYGALTVSADYTAKIPDLSAVRSTITADSRATFVTVRGESINEVTGKVEYTNQQLMFDLTASQPKRTLAAAGSLVVHPDHREVHLQRLSLQTEGISWQTPAGTVPALRVSDESVIVEDFELVSGGDQHVIVKGAFGRPGDTLSVTLGNVDAGAIDALLVRPPIFSGRLDATGTVSGSTKAPQVDAQFQLANGAVQNFRYESLGGTVRYGGRGLTVDATLKQNATQWLTAKGYVPIEAFRSQPSGTAVRAENAAPEDRFDLHIESTPIELGFVQAFTTTLSSVSGIVQAKVDVMGTARDPQPVGAITVQNGAFKVEPTGVSYTGLTGKIDLQPDRIHIDEIRILDSRKQPLTVTGDLALRAFELGEVNITAKADVFQVINNEDGDVRVKSDLRIAGELRAPRIEGDLELTSGTINLDSVLARTQIVYSVKPSEFVTAPGTVAEPALVPNVFDALTANVHVTIPDALVIKASDLRTPDSPVGLGSANVTLGGDVQIVKASGDAMRLTGYLSTVRGYYDFQGRRFSILRDGTIAFENQTFDEFDPRIDINAGRVIQSVTTNVWVGGTLRSPETLLTSTPSLDQADILALIVFNQPLNQLGEGQQISLGQRAQSAAVGVFAGQLASSLANSLNLSQFEISLAPDLSNSAEVTVGQQFGQNLFVKIQRGIGDQTQTNLIVEYEFAPWLRLRTNVLEGSSVQQQRFQRMQGSGIDLLFSFGVTGR